MYLGIDVGGTKTLLASFDEQTGKPTQEVQFPTPATYAGFLEQLEKHLTELGNKKWQAAGIAVPGVIDREHGVGISYGNLSWLNTPIKKDLEKLLGCSVFLENDAKAGGFAEAQYIKNDFKNVLYIALGTGIGITYIKNGVIDVNYGDMGGKAVFVIRDDRKVEWESIISGHAIQRRFGKRATDITDIEVWRTIVSDLADGLVQIIQEKHPDAIVMGGGAGEKFERYGDLLKAELQARLGGSSPKSVPALLPAKHPREAVVYGCYELAKANNV